jgi:nicotinamidase-related amidase
VLNTRNPVNILYPPIEWPVRPEDSALLVVDVQYLFAHPDWGIGRVIKERNMGSEFAYYWDRITAIVPQIRLLQNACRGRGIEVIHTHVAHMTPDCRDSSRGHRYLRFFAPPGSQEAKFLEDVAPIADEVVIAKASASPFNSTAIHQTLRNMGVRNLIMCGALANVSVEMTVRDAADRNYGVIMAHDACASLSEQLHQAMLLTTDGFMGLVRALSVDELLRSLGEQGAYVDSGARAVGPP